MESSPRRSVELEVHRPIRDEIGPPSVESTSVEEIVAAAAKFDWSDLTYRRTSTPRRHQEEFEVVSQPFMSFDLPLPSPADLSLGQPKDGAGANKRVSFVGDKKPPTARQSAEAMSKSPRSSAGGLSPRPAGGLTPRQSLLSRGSQSEGRRTSQFAFEERLDVVRGVMTASIEALLDEVPDFDEDQKRALRFLTDFHEKAFQKEYPSLHPTATASSPFNVVGGDVQLEERRLARQPKGPTKISCELPRIVPKPPTLPAANWLEDKRVLSEVQVGLSVDVSSAAPRENVYLPLRELDDAHIQVLLPQQKHALAELAALGLM